MSDIEGTTVLLGFSGRDTVLGTRETSFLTRRGGFVEMDIPSATAGDGMEGGAIVASEVVRDGGGRVRLRPLRAAPDIFLRWSSPSLESLE